ncbi:hypothetical protein ABBQ32_004178 [Trebouxia sp. C0010 RCD-2024]
MSLTAANLTDGIRVDQATQKGSVYDVISVVTKACSAYAVRVLSRIQKQHPENMTKCHKLRINGKGRETPVADAATLVEIAWLCPGRAATQFRRKGAETVCRMLGGDLTLVDDIQRRHAQVAGTAEEEFLLAGNQGNGNQVVLQELPYSLEQLQQMQAAATSIVASKEGIQQCSVVLQEFPMAKYTQYIDLKDREFDIDCKRFGLKQKEDEHPLRMDRERAELEDCSAKRRRFNGITDDGITFRSLLAKAAEGAGDAKGFEEKTRQMSLGLEVYKAFKEQITGNHRPLHYNTDAADAIAKFITESVAANSKGTAQDLRSYFNAVPRGTLDTGDLYDSP